MDLYWLHHQTVDPPSSLVKAKINPQGRRNFGLDTGQAIGILDRETIHRDQPATIAVRPESASSGREIERAAARHWRPDTRSVATLDAPPPAPWIPPDTETLAVSRRQFLNRGVVALFGLGLSGFAIASLGFLWPRVGGGFGGQIRVGKLSDIFARIDEASGFLYVPEGRMWITRYPPEALEKARATYSPPELAGMEQGVVALYQKCPHLGCHVPECVTSQWFECPCHGSQYNQVGEKKGGPAPRGMDRFACASRAAPSPSTPARSSKAHPSAPTPPAKKPKDPTASLPAAANSPPGDHYTLS